MFTRAGRSWPTTRSAVSAGAPSAMVSHLQRGGGDGLGARRVGCRRRRAGAARRPSPGGSTHRPFTARVAGALVARLAEGLPTAARATAPADEHRRNTPQRACAARAEPDLGNSLRLPPREGLTPKEWPHRSISLGDRLVGCRATSGWRSDAAVELASFSGHRSARQARHSPSRRARSGRGRKPAQQVLKETKWCTALISEGSASCGRVCSLPQPS